MATLDTVDLSSPFQSFLESFEQEPKTLLATQRSLSDFPYTVREIQLMKQGVLARKSKTIFQKSWVPALFVITESGYLHCFRKIHGIDHILQSRRERGVNVPLLRSEFDWAQREQPEYEELAKPKAFWSICLRRVGRVEVELCAGKDGMFVFTLVVTPDGGKFAPTRYDIRAGSEEEMVDWVAAIKTKIEYVPISVSKLHANFQQKLHA